ncbi:MAG: hypothetical protein FHP92_05060 [Denitromonas halophila]|uniref:Uncharacterized protein n=2 Tax=Denitromonas TaxID=139331 RepID=A0A557SFE7_9RHOO|nr:hypothetical protein [Denitromonas ohlonensis]TVT47605.1 MAG: hypothetical protein FHP94_13635 [Denitromonas halophila]TVO63308.1 hypothetical protein FHP90_14865 [Denitromonas ohlonensis]TVO76145.1 hypothetical protein FHP89_11880 [Denitromonas ohlonensis]TVT70038.1 MAG: hypothetical protein FHP93_12640 [Denitromonas halophila]TVT77532.1 MAG: hypothetical protein FHP92_05060 [Denitromonas halophila]
MAMPIRRGDEVTEAVLSRAGRYRKLAENLEIKEVVGDGEHRRRYAVCFNAHEARRQRAHRDEHIKELEADWRALPIGASTATAKASARCARAPARVTC